MNPSRATMSASLLTPASFGTRAALRHSNVIDAFVHHATLRSSAIAARNFNSSSGTAEEITYGELSKRSAALARRLQRMGVSPGARVPLVAKRGIDLLVGILAILSCGAQYVPLDGSVVPESTLQTVIEQAGGQECTVVALSCTAHRINAATVANVICVDDRSDGDEEVDVEKQGLALPNYATAQSGCYVIYTSGNSSLFIVTLFFVSLLTCRLGTTGPSKGVDVTHQNVCNLICLEPGNLGIMEGTRVGQVLNISFDMGLFSSR